MSTPGVAVFSASWTRAPGGEMAAAVRSVAGAVSRLVPVDVFVPGGRPRADGAFDLTPVGWPQDAAAGPWPAALPAARATTTGRYRAVLVETGDRGAHELAASLAPDAPVLSVGRARRTPGQHLAVDLAPEGEPAGPAPEVHRSGLYARVHPGASARRHYGLRAVPDYLLVLGNRPGAPSSRWPSEMVRWMLARFPRRHVVVVEGGVARAWRSRSCVEEFGVHTRMDLWILMARASAMVDLLPGEVFARECVESLRYGVPVAVPAGSVAGGLALGGGGLQFSSTAELLTCVDALSDPATGETLGAAGKALADHWYGDAEGLIWRLAGALNSLGGPPIHQA